METWKAKRDLFTEEEKGELNRAITGQTICPEGITIDLNLLAPELRDKARKELSGVAPVRTSLR